MERNLEAEGDKTQRCKDALSASLISAMDLFQVCVISVRVRHVCACMQRHACARGVHMRGWGRVQRCKDALSASLICAMDLFQVCMIG